MDSALRLLGLIYRAKKMILGEEVLERFSEVKLLVIASDISDKSRERYLKKCHFYNIDYVDRYTGEQLSSCLGRKNIKTIGIIDEGFTKSFLEKL